MIVCPIYHAAKKDLGSPNEEWGVDQQLISKLKEEYKKERKGKKSSKYGMNTPDWWQSKTLLLSTNVDQKSLETEFSLAICRLNGDKWQSKMLFLKIFDLCLLIVKSVLDCRLSSVGMEWLRIYLQLL